LEADSLNFEQGVWNDSITVYGPDYWEMINCLTCNIADPNGDDYDETLNPTGLEGNEVFDWLDCGNDGLCDSDFGYPGPDENEGNGLHDFNEICEPFTDPNGNSIYDPTPDNYNETLKRWEWEFYSTDSQGDSIWVKSIRITGEPAINRIKWVNVGVQNMSDETIYGKILLDELRMTNVKKERGRALRVQGSINFADLLDVSTNYSRTDANFHSLRDRLGTGDNSRDFSISTKISPDLILPSAWGIKTPVNINYSHRAASPKYRTGTDILVGDFEDAPDSIKTISESLKLSTRFQKSSRSENWFAKYTIDRLTISNVSAILTRKSTVLIEKEETRNYKMNGKYSLTFQDHFFKPLAFMKKMPLIGSVFEDTRVYWTPTSVDASMSLEDNKKITYNRNGTVTDPAGTLLMNRDFNVKYKVTKSISSTYSKSIKSNLEDFYDDKMRALVKLAPGRIESINESLNNTFSPDFMKWLKPKVKYNINYTWNRTNIDTLNNVASLSNKNSFDVSTNFNLQIFPPLPSSNRLQ